MIPTEPPADLVDWVVVQRMVEGQRPGREPTPAEVHGVINEMMLRGLGCRVIAPLLGLPLSTTESRIKKIRDSGGPRRVVPW